MKTNKQNAKPVFTTKHWFTSPTETITFDQIVQKKVLVYSGDDFSDNSEYRIELKNDVVVMTMNIKNEKIAGIFELEDKEHRELVLNSYIDFAAYSLRPKSQTIRFSL